MKNSYDSSMFKGVNSRCSIENAINNGYEIEDLKERKNYFEALNHYLAVYTDYYGEND